MGFKTFAVGEVLTAADLMTYLMKQVVIVCTSSTRPASPVEGMVIYETNTDLFRVHNGTTWSSVPRLDVANTFATTVTATAAGDNSVSFADNDNHGWESNGSGGWRFANRWGTPGSIFTFVGGDDTVELARFSDDGIYTPFGIEADGALDVAGTATIGGTVAAGGKVSATATPGGTHISYEDNDLHFWESDGSGGWRFANRWGSVGALFTFVGGDDTLELVRFTDPTTNGDTALHLGFISPTGTLRFKQVRVSAAGEVDGTSRRYLYMVDA